MVGNFGVGVIRIFYHYGGHGAVIDVLGGEDNAPGFGIGQVGSITPVCIKTDAVTCCFFQRRDLANRCLCFSQRSIYYFFQLRQSDTIFFFYYPFFLTSFVYSCLASELWYSFLTIM